MSKAEDSGLTLTLGMGHCLVVKHMLCLQKAPSQCGSHVLCSRSSGFEHHMLGANEWLVSQHVSIRQVVIFYSGRAISAKGQPRHGNGRPMFVCLFLTQVCPDHMLPENLWSACGAVLARLKNIFILISFQWGKVRGLPPSCNYWGLLLPLLPVLGRECLFITCFIAAILLPVLSCFDFLFDLL